MSRTKNWAVPLLLVIAAAVLGYFAVQNVQTYRASNYPPDGAEVVTVHVMSVETQENCGSPAGHCISEVDGLTFLAPGLETQTAPAHAAFSPGDEVRAFRDADGHWQVLGAFPRTWLVRTVGFTAGGALALLMLAGYAVLRGVRGAAGGNPSPASSAAPPL